MYTSSLSLSVYGCAVVKAHRFFSPWHRQECAAPRRARPRRTFLSNVRHTRMKQTKVQKNFHTFPQLCLSVCLCMAAFSLFCFGQDKRQEQDAGGTEGREKVFENLNNFLYTATAYPITSSRPWDPQYTQSQREREIEIVCVYVCVFF